MRLNNWLTILGLFGCMTSANAQSSASIVCSSDSRSWKSVPVLKVSYNTGADANKPGLFWFGIISEDQTTGAVLTSQGWQDYQGGLYPFHSRYDNGLTPVINLSIPIPNSATNTSSLVGYIVYAGHGVYLQDSRQKVIERRSVLDSVKADLVAKGRWQVQYETDENYIISLVQRDMVNNKKYGPALTIPYVDCEPQTGG